MTESSAVRAMRLARRRGMLIAEIEAARRFRSSEVQVLVNCEDPLCCDSELIRRVEGVITGTLERFGEPISRVEVWLRDLHSEKPGDRDKVCTLEARVAGVSPLTAEHEAPTLAEAIHVATGKLERLVERQLRSAGSVTELPARP